LKHIRPTPGSRFVPVMEISIDFLHRNLAVHWQPAEVSGSEVQIANLFHRGSLVHLA
jgi:hypothetical protein